MAKRKPRRMRLWKQKTTRFCI